jgi:hypothetical protein
MHAECKISQRLLFEVRKVVPPESKHGLRISPAGQPLYSSNLHLSPASEAQSTTFPFLSEEVSSRATSSLQVSVGASNSLRIHKLVTLNRTATALLHRNKESGAASRGPPTPVPVTLR